MEEDQIVVDLEASHLAESIQHKLNTLWGEPNEPENFTIFRVPRHIRQNRKNLIEPFVVSIGPFHHGKMGLRAMEEQKWRFLRDFLSRGDHISLDLCISEMKLIEERTRRCYSETVNLDSNVFVEKMLLDGCFILEYMLKRRERRWDSINEVGWNCEFIKYDFLLLENQIPFFVVEKLWEIGVKQEDTRIHLVNDLVRFIMYKGPTDCPIFVKPPDEIYHLIHLFHYCSVPNPEKPVVSSSKSFQLIPNRIKYLLLGFLSCVLTRGYPSSTRKVSTMVMTCATVLQDSGVKFRPKTTPQHMLDISFDHGVLEIPRLRITFDTKPFLVNLIAFEQCNLGNIGGHLTSFASFLDSLVNTQKDVIMLEQCGIIENCLNSEEDLTTFFNQICDDGVFLRNNHFLAELTAEVNKYCESSWNRQRAKLIREYFSSPWAVISVVAALLLLLLTCVQSFMAVYAYVVPRS